MEGGRWWEIRTDLVLKKPVELLRALEHRRLQRRALPRRQIRLQGRHRLRHKRHTRDALLNESTWADAGLRARTSNESTCADTGVRTLREWHTFSRGASNFGSGKPLELRPPPPPCC